MGQAMGLLLLVVGVVGVFTLRDIARSLRPERPKPRNAFLARWEGSERERARIQQERLDKLSL